MKIMRKKNMFFVTFSVVLFFVLLSGCMNIMAEELYALPRLSDEYMRLQLIIEDVIEQGAELSPPIGGLNRQAVQLKDLTGDGTNEVVAFFSLPEEGLLNLYIFSYEGGDYSVAEIIEVSGIAFENVKFVDMDGDGIVEVTIGWQVNPTLRQMEIFTIKDFNAVSLARTTYIDIMEFDLTGDGNSDIIVVIPLRERGAVISAYALMSSGELVRSSAELLNEVGAYVQMLTGRLIDDTPAIFVESEVATEEGYQTITEIYVFYGGDLTRTTLNRDR